MLFDTHAHLTSETFDEDRDRLIESYPSQNIALILNPAWNFESSFQASALSQKHDSIYAAVGNHPDSAHELSPEHQDAILGAYKKLVRENNRIRAIGEVGLDYHYETVPREMQQHAFRVQMALARELNLPVIVHEREAHEDGLKIIDEFPEVKGVFHCYSGSVEMALELVSRGWFIGFTGILTFKNAALQQEVARSVPLDHIVIETDSPYLAPIPYRGRRCDPVMLPRVAQKLAELRHLSLDEVEAATFINGKRLYRIDN